MAKYLLQTLTPRQRLTAEKNGVSIQTLSKRLGKGWDVERAISEPTGRSKEHKWGDYIVTPEHLEQARKLGINSGTVHNRIMDGWTLERAISESPISRSQHGKRMRKLAWDNIPAMLTRRSLELHRKFKGKK